MVSKAYASTVTVFRNSQPFVVRGVKLSQAKGSSFSTDGAEASNSMTIFFNPRFSRCDLGVPFKEEDYVMLGEASAIDDTRLVVNSVSERTQKGAVHHVEVLCG